MNKRTLTYEREVSQPARCPFWLWELPSSLYIPSSLLVSCTLTISYPQITHLELWARRQRLRLPIVRKSLCCYIIKHDNGTFCICIRRPWFPDSVWKWQSHCFLSRGVEAEAYCQAEWAGKQLQGQQYTAHRFETLILVLIINWYTCSSS